MRSGGESPDLMGLVPLEEETPESLGLCATPGHRRKAACWPGRWLSPEPKQLAP